ncbi:metal-dependent hydrolase, partial [Candidatus Parcubacteria bacterium A4]
MEVKYFGHAAFLIEDLLIDPFLKSNPLFKENPENIKCKIICITHDNHLGDAFDIARVNDATIVSIWQIANIAISNGLKVEAMNIGGWLKIGNWKIKMTEALHSTSSGHAVGFILKNMDFDTTVYHAGDTGLFSDMKLIGEEGIDIAMLPIGDRYTMGVKDALRAVTFIKPKIVIPMHYNTYPIIEVDPDNFSE